MVTSETRCPHCGTLNIQPGRVLSGPGWELQEGDCRQLMARISAGSVDAIITDPPYGSGGDTARERMRSAKIKYVSSGCSYQSSLPDIDGDALHPEQWADHMRDWLKECARVLAPDGVFLSFMDWRNGPTFQRLILSAGIRLRGLAIWDKGIGARPYPGGFRNQAELIYWGGNSPAPRSVFSRRTEMFHADQRQSPHHPKTAAADAGAGAHLQARRVDSGPLRRKRHHRPGGPGGRVSVSGDGISPRMLGSRRTSVERHPPVRVTLQPTPHGER